MYTITNQYRSVVIELDLKCSKCGSKELVERLMLWPQQLNGTPAITVDVCKRCQQIANELIIQEQLKRKQTLQSESTCLDIQPNTY